MYNELIGILLGLIVSYLLFIMLKNRSSIIIGSSLIEKYKDKCITCDNRCSRK